LRKSINNLIKKIKDVINKDSDKKFLRLMVEGGGCSGYQYLFNMDNKINSDDIILEKDDAKVVIDKLSIPYLDGAKIDFKESMIRSAFQVMENPKAEVSCSCGSSFAPKI
jgi:iron-sulfur cluster assembly accessory protein